MAPLTDSLPIDESLDVAFADRLARFETYNKHHYRPNTYLHKWWGRRCGSTFRLILKGLVEDPSLRSYYEPGGLEGKVILDPMMGGGTTLHEAIRLGASVMGVDVDPIPVLQSRASLTELPLTVLRAGFESFYDSLQSAIGEFYITHCPVCDERTPFWHALYGLKRRCACGEVIVVDSLGLRQEPDGSLLSWCPYCRRLMSGQDHECPAGRTQLVEKSQTVCAHCGEEFKDLLELPYFQRYELLALAGHCSTHGLFHKSPDSRDRDIHQRAESCRSSFPLAESEFCVVPGDKSVHLSRRNIHSYLDLFSSRQLLYLREVIRVLPHHDRILRLNLALLASTSLEFNSMLCGYKGVKKRRAGAVRHTFSHHGYSFPYTALENNPIYPRRASGTLQKLFYNRIWRARRWASEPLERDITVLEPRFLPISGERDQGIEVANAAALSGNIRRVFLLQGSSSSLPADDGSVDAVVTDPPYYDSIQYGDLAAFFRVWLRHFLPDEADWEYDGTFAAVNSERDTSGTRYIALMSEIFRECRRVLRPERGRLIFTFHHWQPKAWAALTISLYQAGFKLLNRYVVHAEHPISVHISNMRALTHDAILVLAPRAAWAGSTWARPDPLHGRDSLQFTEGCATMLGWILDQPDLSTDRIVSLWLDEIPADG